MDKSQARYILAVYVQNTYFFRIKTSFDQSPQQIYERRIYAKFGEITQLAICRGLICVITRNQMLKCYLELATFMLQEADCFKNFAKSLVLISVFIVGYTKNLPTL